MAGDWQQGIKRKIDAEDRPERGAMSVVETRGVRWTWSSGTLLGRGGCGVLGVRHRLLAAAFQGSKAPCMAFSSKIDRSTLGGGGGGGGGRRVPADKGWLPYSAGLIKLASCLRWWVVQWAETCPSWPLAAFCTFKWGQCLLCMCRP